MKLIAAISHNIMPYSSEPLALLCVQVIQLVFITIPWEPQNCKCGSPFYVHSKIASSILSFAAHPTTLRTSVPSQRHAMLLVQYIAYHSLEWVNGLPSAPALERQSCPSGLFRADPNLIVAHSTMSFLPLVAQCGSLPDSVDGSAPVPKLYEAACLHQYRVL